VTSLAIMQPYFLPYVGYFQLICAADKFVIYDNIQYTKKGWINRNRFLRDGKDELFTVPLKGAPDGLDVCDRTISDDFRREKLLNQFREAYRRAPFFPQTMALCEEIVLFREPNLFRYIQNSVVKVCEFLDIQSEFIASSSIEIDHSLKGKNKVLEICANLQASSYVNPVGGLSLYSKDEFASHGIDLYFLKSNPLVYPQFGDAFVPSLSIVDVMMFNPPAEIKPYLLSGYELL
jgi:hypothetical protein